MLVLAVSVVASFLATAAAYRLVADAYLGRAVDPGASLRFGLKRVGAVIWVSLLAGLGVLVGLAAARRPGRVPRGRLVGRDPGAAGREPARPRGALRARARSCAGASGRARGVLFLSFLLAGIVALAIEFVVIGITGSSDNDSVIFFTQGISSLISNTLVLPFQVAVTTVLYIDLRVRKEGFDIQLLAHSLEPGGTGET